MDISLIVSGNIKIHKQSVNLHQLFEEIYQKFHSKCIAKNIEFIIQISLEKNGISLYCDASLLEKSISHLVDNAIKFTQRGSIILGLRRENNEFQIFRKDTRSGIKQDA